MIFVALIIDLLSIIFWAIPLLMLFWHFRLLWPALIHFCVCLALYLFAFSTIRPGFIFDNVDNFVLLAWPCPIYGLILMIGSIRKVNRYKLEKIKADIEQQDKEFRKRLLRDE